MGELLEEIIEYGGEIFGREHMETIRECVQCGKCTGSCPSGRITAYRTRKMIQMARMNMREVLSMYELWFCTTCFTCYERCPRGVKTTDIVRTIRNIAVKEGHMSLSHKKVATYVFKTGHAVPIGEPQMKQREAVGLDSMAPTTQKFKEQLEQVRTIVKTTGFDKKVGFDWETMKLREELESESKK